ncbi:epidermal growth factor receptor substrate 15-like 1 [Iris pallida]|uniref:Epidermal growth factor receptor substrate 15-like 1 n=1 Tax=Iris pallida TaxID=29817 RepID=A0AAX6DZS2_IRIPA|nr:epidermal growth factor receptor substrate 15-like 1 [Iris pallida]
MQELVLYKSRCDNRLNEITERASSDKREVESLAKKYEEKYKQVADVASKLTVEEATLRDIQERKLELQNALVKMEQGGSIDGLLQVRADRIQSDLEELAKALNERCKHHGINVKMASIELPFGWQPGIQEGAVDWMRNGINLKMKVFQLQRNFLLTQRMLQNLPKSLPQVGAKRLPLLQHPLMSIAILVTDLLRMAQLMIIVKMDQQGALLVVPEEMLLEVHQKNFTPQCTIYHPMPKIVTVIMVEQNPSFPRTSLLMIHGVLLLMLTMMLIQFGALMQRSLIIIPFMILESLV